MRPKPTAEAEIRRSFDEAARDNEHFPATVDPRIQHVQVLLAAFAETRGTILDAGSGKGRYAWQLVEHHTHLRALCLDLSHSMLQAVPAPLRPVQASLQALPFADHSLAGAFAIESLEHVPNPAAAVAELCRILVPGSPVVIIDKNAAQWGRFQCPAWERWFFRHEVEQWLAPFCEDIRSDALSYWADVPSDGLFWVWTARKRP